MDNTKEIFFACIYVLAWNNYRDVAPKIPRAWLFTQPEFMNKVLYSVLEKALQDFWTFCDETTMYLYNTMWGPNIWTVISHDSNRIINDVHDSAEQLMDILPPLDEAFHWELADLVTDEYVQKQIPAKDDPCTGELTRMAWDDETAQWMIKPVQRNQGVKPKWLG